jgi:L-ribulose-5-phosphate 3-epimerase
MEVGCSTYSYHKAFGEGRMNMDSFLDKMHDLGVKGIEILDGHMPTGEEALRKMKRKALKLGIEITALTISPSSEITSISPPRSERTDPVKKIEKWIRIASLLGAPAMRVDVILPERKAGVEEVTRININAIKKVLPIAIENGIALGMENHSLFRLADNVLSVVRGVNSEWYGTVPDVGNFVLGNKETAYEEIEKVAPYAIFCHAKTLDLGLGWEGLSSYWEEKVVDYRRVIEIFRRHGFDGYMSQEYEGEEAEETAVPKGHEFLTRLIG